MILFQLSIHIMHTMSQI